ncbi:MAG: carbamoyltransferase HypF [candidate division WOR-3 bacterium]
MKQPSFCIVIKGQVQGLGFRPFVFRLAKSYNIKGYVANTLTGVVILAQGDKVKDFIHRLRSFPPPMAKITSFQVTQIKTKPFAKFSIRHSIESTTAQIGRPIPGDSPQPTAAEVLPDLNICPECRRELLTPTDRRFLYPFINCTQCGPRYTIIENLPYDRVRTTMSRFLMCPECRKEYLDPSNRRFHAEPIACPKCGPKLRLHSQLPTANCRQPAADSLILLAAQALANGKLVAIKGLGGFHIACDATNDQAVRLLRESKERRSKPLALMVDDLNTARSLCQISATAAKLLRSSAAPILLLPKKVAPAISLSPLVAPNNPNLGVMLAYTPLHLLLFQFLRSITNKPPVLVMTSANPADEPIATTEKELLSQLEGAPSKIQKQKSKILVLTHNRAIANRCDDSVLIVDGKNPVMVRRARGYAPQPLSAGERFHVKHTTLGIGGDQRNTFCLARGKKLFLSPHIGDMASRNTERFFLKTLQRLTAWTKLSPERIVCDLHPDYHSTRLAERLSQELGAKLLRVQHHYAHILSVMVEHNLSGPVLGLAFDGTGYGTDGAIWGCEFLLINNDLSWARVGHLGYLEHTAGADIIADPVELAIAYSLQSGVEKSALLNLNLTDKNINTTAASRRPVVTSSLGRLFDSVAAITGICRRATFEGEAAIALEAAAVNAKKGRKVGFQMLNRAHFCRPHSEFRIPLIIDPKPIIYQTVEKVLAKEPPERVALWFHQTLVHLFVTGALHLARKFRTKTICFSGGCFQNTLLRRGLKKSLIRAGMQVYHNQSVPLNDGGLSLGQVAIAIF